MSRSKEKTGWVNITADAERRVWWMLGFWVIFMVIVPVTAQIQASRTDVLKGKSGEDSCTLKHSLDALCPSSPIAPDDNPPPSDCACNNQYFNIWSSCMLSSGHATLPTYRNWTLSCQSVGIKMQNNDVVRLEGKVPMWAFIQVPGDTTFDVQGAVLLATPPHWTPLQVALPWCSALLSLITTLVVVRFWKSSKSASTRSTPFSQRLKHGLAGFKFWSHRVRPVDTQKMDGEWTIDSPREGGTGSIKSTTAGPSRKETYETYVFVDRMSPTERSPVSPIDTIPAHPSIASDLASRDRLSTAVGSANGRRASEALRDSRSIGSVAAAMGADHNGGRALESALLDLDLTEGDTSSERPPGGLVHVPGMDFTTRNRPFLVSGQPTNGTLSSPSPDDLSSSYPFSSPKSGFGSHTSRTGSPASGFMGNIRSIGDRVFKRQPRRVMSMKPTRKFRIDLDVASSKASSAAGSGVSEVGGPSAFDALSNRNDDPELAMAIHQEVGGETGESSVGYGQVDEDEERQTLISSSERESSVLMIGDPTARSVADSSSKSAYSRHGTNISSSINSHIEIMSATTGPGSPTRPINPTNSSLLWPPPQIVVPPPPTVQPPPVPVSVPQARLRDPPLAFPAGRAAPHHSPSSPPQHFADSDPRGFTSNLRIQTHPPSNPPQPPFSFQDLGASESPLAPPPINRFHAMTPIQEDARSYAGRSSPTISTVSTPRPSSPALSYVASASLPRSSSPSPALPYSSIISHPRRNQSNDSSHSINILSPASNSDHSRSGSITTPTTPLNVGIRRKASNESTMMLSSSSNMSSPVSAAPSPSSSNNGIMHIISTTPRPRTPDPLLLTLARSELVRTGSNQSQRSIRPLPSPGIPQGGGQHQKSLSQNDTYSSSPPFRTHTPTLSGSGVIGMGSPLAQSQSPSYFHSQPGTHHIPDDRFDAVLSAGEFSRTTGGHRRGLLPEDRSSFYMTPDPLLTPVTNRAFSPQRRNFSADNSSEPVDPISLVPLAVRGAGYRIDGKTSFELA